MVFAYMPMLLWASAALLAAAMASNVLWMFSSTLLQLSVPDAYRGRVFAADFALFTVVMAVSTFLTGWGIDHGVITPRGMAALLGALLCLIGVGWLPLSMRQAMPGWLQAESGEGVGTS
jgi:hypothetical protein